MKTDDVSALTVFYSALKHQKWVKYSKFIDKTSVPIIKLTTSESLGDIQVDISIKDKQHLGLKCIKLVKSYIEEYPCLKVLVPVVKQILKYANLNNPFTGGISSYGIILMLVFFIQRSVYEKTMKKNDCSRIFQFNNAEYGKTLYDFLCFYGEYFDNLNTAVVPYCKAEYMDNSNFNPPNVSTYLIRFIFSIL